MRFVSRNANLLVVLKPGLPAQPVSGLPARPTISVRFKDGIADVPEGEICDLMLNHPGFNSDYVSAESVGNKDPYASARVESEPPHTITELKYGTPEKVIRDGKTKLTPELDKLVKELAISMAKELLPEMVKSTLKSLVETHESSKKVKGKPGRKPLIKAVPLEVEQKIETPENTA